ncbi:MAG: flocculation-associated PEP-CTERM protein PepA [Vicinamibacterales bacterium]
MKNIGKLVLRGAGTLAVAGVALMMTPGVAHADNIAFTLAEGNTIVPGSNTATYTVDDINGKYNESLTFGVGNTFTANLVVQFATYLNTVGITETPVATQLGAPVPGGETVNTNLYAMYALVTVSGSYSTNLIGSDLLYTFAPLSASASIWLDPTRDTVTNFTTASVASGGGEDLQVLSATAIDSYLSYGSVTVRGGNVIGGSYSLTFTNPALVNPTGPAYWPDLNLMTLAATASGDVDTTNQGSVFPSAVKGDTDLTFTQNPVPEPASLLLLGSGLLGACAGTRRRKKQ